MNAIVALFDDLADFVKPVFAAVIGFQGTTRSKSRADYCKNHGMKEGLEIFGKRTVDKNVLIIHLLLAKVNFDESLWTFAVWPLVDRNEAIASSSCLSVKCVARPRDLRITTPSWATPATA